MSCNINLFNQFGILQGVIGFGIWYIGKFDIGFVDFCEDLIMFFFKDGYEDGIGNEVFFVIFLIIIGDLVDFIGFDFGIYYFIYWVVDGMNMFCNVCVVVIVIVWEGVEIIINNNVDVLLCMSDGIFVNVYSDLFDIVVILIFLILVSWVLINVIGILVFGVIVILGSDLVFDMGLFSWVNGIVGVVEDFVIDFLFLDDQIEGLVVYELELIVDNFIVEILVGCDNCVVI